MSLSGLVNPKLMSQDDCKDEPAPGTRCDGEHGAQFTSGGLFPPDRHPCSHTSSGASSEIFPLSSAVSVS